MSKLVQLSKGEIKISIGMVITIVTIVGGAIGTFYAAQADAQERTNDVKDELNASLTLVLQRLSVVEKGMENFEKVQTSQTADIKQILQIIK